MPDLEDVTFLLPGPVKLHPRVLRALSLPSMPHRSPEFTAALGHLTEGLKEVFGTFQDVTVLSGSGTAGMEAAVGSLVKKGDRVVALSNGKFGERMADISALHGDAVRVTAPWGQGFDLGEVERALKGGETKALTFVLNETSTGVMNQGKEIAWLAREHGALVIMDAVTAVGSVPVPVDEWGVDVCIVGSQKCLAAPPGLAFLSVSEEAYSRLHRFSYYLDLKKHIDKTRAGSTPFTPAVPLYLAATEAIRIALEEGLDARYERTRRMADATRAAATALGLELYAAEDVRSDTVTAIRYPDVPDAEKAIRGRMKDAHGVLVAGGQDEVKGRIFRIGHMANARPEELAGCFHALESCLIEAGHDFVPGAGTGALVRAFSRAPDAAVASGRSA
ncbi:MAG: alanine--glyoxylate aminotransferase family protein [Euryarchaeota archaeon]|nr:alanine--glyoxylate aminotransferase family protein [Euryarchaeota archaeon]